jgi:hypothetical protein
MNTLSGSAEKSCRPCKEPKAPVFRLGDVVINGLGEVITINIIRQQGPNYIEYGYVPGHSDRHEIGNIRMYSGHALKKYIRKSK